MASKTGQLVRLGEELYSVDELRARWRTRKTPETYTVQSLLADRGLAGGALYAVEVCLKRLVESYLRKDWFTDDEDVSEVWIDCLLRVSTRATSFDPDRSTFVTWVFNQAKYAALDLRRKHAAETRADRAALAQRLPSEHWDDEPEPLSDRERAGLRQARRNLSKTERSLLDMKYVEGMSYREIAEACGVDNHSNLRVAVHRAARRLDRLYKSELKG